MYISPSFCHPTTLFGKSSVTLCESEAKIFMLALDAGVGDHLVVNRSEEPEK